MLERLLAEKDTRMAERDEQIAVLRRRVRVLVASSDDRRGGRTGGEPPPSGVADATSPTKESAGRSVDMLWNVSGRARWDLGRAS